MPGAKLRNISCWAAGNGALALSSKYLPFALNMPCVSSIITYWQLKFLFLRIEAEKGTFA